jgi:hypothetical protein
MGRRTDAKEAFDEFASDAPSSGEMSIRSAGAASGLTGGSSASVLFPGGGIEQMAVAHLSSADGAYTLVEGQIDPSVTGVALVRSDGTDIDTTTGSGWLVAWWPGDLDASAAQITTASGMTTENLSTLNPSSPPAVGSGAGSCGATGGTPPPNVACSGTDGAGGAAASSSAR